jgi:sugar phosphate isomerase/epimerase
MATRREFIASTSAAAAALAAGCRTGGAASVASGANGAAAMSQGIRPLGVGLFTVLKPLDQDFDGTLAMIAGLGYKKVEFFGPYDFSVPSEIAGWKQVAAQLGVNGSGLYGRTPQQVRAILDRNGLVSPSMHVGLDTLRQRLEQVGEAAHTIGWKYCGLAAIPEEMRRTTDDYRKMADELNSIGARAKPMGFKILYHNHGYGLLPVDGVVPEQILRDRLDPDLVSLEMDVFWTVAGGVDPVQLLDAYPRLYRLMHVKDMIRQARFEHGGTQQDWIALFPLMTTSGKGVLDLPRILGHAKRNGVEHFYVEQDMAADAPAQLGASISYLRSMQLVTT